MKMFVSYAFEEIPHAPVRFSSIPLRREIIPYYPRLCKVNYKQLTNRIYNTMIDPGITLSEDYADYLKAHPEEIELFRQTDHKTKEMVKDE